MKTTKKIFGSLAGALAISLAAGLSFTACSDSGESSVSADDRNKQSETASGTTTIKAYLPGNDGKALKKAAFNGNNLTTVATTYTDDGDEIKVSWREPIEGDPNSLEKFDVFTLTEGEDCTPESEGGKCVDVWSGLSGRPVAMDGWGVAYGPEIFKMTFLGTDGVGTFSGTLPENCDKDRYALCYAFYPAGSAEKYCQDIQVYANQAENLSMESLYKYDYMYSAIQMVDGTPTVNFKHDVALLDITIKPIGTKENIDTISVEYMADAWGDGALATTTYSVRYEESQTFVDTVRVIIAVPPSNVPQGDTIKVYFKAAGQETPADSNIYVKTIQKEGGVSIEAGKYYAMTFENDVCGEGGTPYNPYVQECNEDDGVIKTYSICGEVLYDAESQWCNTANNQSKVEALLIDARDNKKYKTVEIGSQTWMAENLNYATTDSKCYDNDPDNCAKYGRLYTWADAMALDLTYNTQSAADEVQTQHQGICPDGWHVPTQAEFNILYVSHGSTAQSPRSNVLRALKSTTEWPQNGSSGKNTKGFSVLPAGICDTDNKFEGLGNASYLGGNTEMNGNSQKIQAQTFYSDDGSVNVMLMEVEKVEGTSLRCIKDAATSN